jgi:hypothetical protein
MEEIKNVINIIQVSFFIYLLKKKKTINNKKDKEEIFKELKKIKEKHSIILKENLSEYVEILFYMKIKENLVFFF